MTRLGGRRGCGGRGREGWRGRVWWGTGRAQGRVRARAPVPHEARRGAGARRQWRSRLLLVQSQSVGQSGNAWPLPAGVRPAPDNEDNARDQRRQKIVDCVWWCKGEGRWRGGRAPAVKTRLLRGEWGAPTLQLTPWPCICRAHHMQRPHAWSSHPAHPLTRLVFVRDGLQGRSKNRCGDRQAANGSWQVVQRAAWQGRWPPGAGPVPELRPSGPALGRRRSGLVTPHAHRVIQEHGPLHGVLELADGNARGANQDDLRGARRAGGVCALAARGRPGPPRTQRAPGAGPKLRHRRGRAGLHTVRRPTVLPPWPGMGLTTREAAVHSCWLPRGARGLTTASDQSCCARTARASLAHFGDVPMLLLRLLLPGWFREPLHGLIAGSGTEAEQKKEPAEVGSLPTKGRRPALLPQSRTKSAPGCGLQDIHGRSSAAAKPAHHRHPSELAG
jgi:hypothetical protein